MGKKALARELESLLRTKRVHEVKKWEAEKDGNYNLAYFHEKEISEMDRRIADLERTLNSSEDECPSCGRWVVPINNICPKCQTYMG